MTEPTQASIAFAELIPDDFLAALDEAGFRTDGRLLALNSYENRVYQVGIEDDRPLVVKFYRPNRWSDAAILEEHRFSQTLADAEIPVVPPIAVDGETLLSAHDFRFSVFPCHGGRAPELDDLDMLEQLGRLIARIHLVGEQEDFSERPEMDIDSYIVEPSDFLLDENFIPTELGEVYDSVIDQLLERVDETFERTGDVDLIRLHGDFHTGNVLVAEDRFHIVDMDDCRTGPSVQDLWMFLSGERSEQTPQLTALLEGYQQFRQFDAIELNLVEALRTMRIVHYAGWLAKRWEDPAFQRAFPWFNSIRYWEEHILTLKEQIANLDEPPLQWTDAR